MLEINPYAAYRIDGLKGWWIFWSEKDDETSYWVSANQTDIEYDETSPKADSLKNLNKEKSKYVIAPNANIVPNTYDEINPLF